MAVEEPKSPGIAPLTALGRRGSVPIHLIEAHRKMFPRNSLSQTVEMIEKDKKMFQNPKRYTLWSSKSRDEKFSEINRSKKLRHLQTNLSPIFPMSGHIQVAIQTLFLQIQKIGQTDKAAHQNYCYRLRKGYNFKYMYVFQISGLS